jgi:hypothetical protein
METISRSYQRTGDPLGILAAITGAAGAACAGILWYCQARPNNWLGSAAFEIAHGGPLRDTLLAGALFLGLIAVVASVPSALGRQAVHRGVPLGLVFGLLALSYPIAFGLHWVRIPGLPG